MKKILVLVVDYPNNMGGVALMYVHVRNKYYMQHGIDVTVLNFSSHEDYIIDGIPVITLKTYENSPDQYEILVLHAANIRNHYRFLRKFEKKFAHLIFFFHGHEVMKINKAYPKPYNYTKKDSVLNRIIQNCYDSLKLSLWHKYFPKVAYKTDFIFVSKWFYHEFERYVRLTGKDLENHVHIIYNSVGEIFENNSYHYGGEKEYDFISIRSYMDKSKYCMDIINTLAKNNPQFKFLVIGKGEFYRKNKKPKNVVWLEETLNHESMIYYVDKSACALLPTRLDAQGVMMCEMATYGIPVITSSLPVCQEVLGDFLNVAYIDNDDIEHVDLSQLYKGLLENEPYNKTVKFGYEHTVKLEENLLHKIMNDIDRTS